MIGVGFLLVSAFVIGIWAGRRSVARMRLGLERIQVTATDYGVSREEIRSIAQSALKPGHTAVIR